VKPARLRPRAKEDLSDQAWYYADVAGEVLASRFLDESLAALATIERNPGVGSTRWSGPDTTEPLRAWRVERFPVVWLYFERDDHVDVARLLGQRQDIAAILGADLD